MLLPVAGRAGGNRKRTVVRATYTTEICHTSQSLSDMDIHILRVAYGVHNPANGAGEDEGTLGDHLASAEHVDGNGYAIGQVQHHNRRRNNGVEGAVFD